MDSQRLRYFVTLAEDPSLRRAAKQLGIDETTLSRRVTALEGELGIDLFVREKGRYTGLSAAGRSYLRDARRILQQLDRAAESAHAIAAGRTDRLRIGVCEDAAAGMLSRILLAFSTEKPQIAVELFELPTAAQADSLHAAEIDCGLLLPPVGIEGITVKPLWDESWLVALPTTHELSRLPQVTPEQLAEVHLVLTHPDLGPGCHLQALDALKYASKTRRPRYQVLSRATAIMLVQSGMGAALLPASLAGYTIPDVALVPLVAPPMHIAGAYRDDELPTGDVIAFVQAATATIGHGLSG